MLMYTTHQIVQIIKSIKLKEDTQVCRKLIKNNLMLTPNFKYHDCPQLPSQRKAYKETGYLH